MDEGPETRDEEWTKGRKSEMTRQVHSAALMNPEKISGQNDSDSSDRRGIQLGDSSASGLTDCMRCMLS